MDQRRSLWHRRWMYLCEGRKRKRRNRLAAMMLKMRMRMKMRTQVVSLSRAIWWSEVTTRMGLTLMMMEEQQMMQAGNLDPSREMMLLLCRSRNRKSQVALDWRMTPTTTTTTLFPSLPNLRNRRLKRSLVARATRHLHHLPSYPLSPLDSQEVEAMIQILMMIQERAWRISSGRAGRARGRIGEVNVPGNCTSPLLVV